MGYYLLCYFVFNFSVRKSNKHVLIINQNSCHSLQKSLVKGRRIFSTRKKIPKTFAILGKSVP